MDVLSYVCLCSAPFLPLMAWGLWLDHKSRARRVIGVLLAGPAFAAGMLALSMVSVIALGYPEEELQFIEWLRFGLLAGAVSAGVGLVLAVIAYIVMWVNGWKDTPAGERIFSKFGCAPLFGFVAGNLLYGFTLGTISAFEPSAAVLGAMGVVCLFVWFVGAISLLLDARQDRPVARLEPGASMGRLVRQTGIQYPVNEYCEIPVYLKGHPWENKVVCDAGLARKCACGKSYCAAHGAHGKCMICVLKELS